MNKLKQKQHFQLSNVTALLIVSVIAWLWVVPVIDSLDSYTYGMATRALIVSFIPFVIGVVTAVAFPSFTTCRRGLSSLILGSILLAISLVFYMFIYQHVSFWIVRHLAIFRMLGFALLGYGLQAIDFGKPRMFKVGLAVLIVLYIIYNLLIWGMNNVPCQYMPLYHLANIAYALVRIAIVITLWETLSADSVTSFLSRIPRFSLLIAGLFWGMFLVIPADRYSPRWLAILMLFLAPLFAYIYSVLIRFAVKLLRGLFKGIISNRGWWKDVCCWWN